jgi:mannose/fructose/N-acetylgalactosamine-specific phosphotransferase system component IIC
MSFDPGTWVLLLALGLWTALDQSACLQVLVSQPLVASWLAGWVAGDAASGLAIGVLLQGVWSRALPLGASPLPLLGPAAVVGGALAAVAPGPRVELGPALSIPGAVPLAIVLWMSIAVGESGRPLLQQIYRRRATIVEMALAAAGEGRADRLRIAHLLGVLPTGGLGVSLVAAGLVLGSILLRVGPNVHADGRWVALPVLGVGVGQACSLSMKRRAWIWGAAALLLGLAVAFI